MGLKNCQILKRTIQVSTIFFLFMMLNPSKSQFHFSATNASLMGFLIKDLNSIPEWNTKWPRWMETPMSLRMRTPFHSKLKLNLSTKNASRLKEHMKLVLFVIKVLKRQKNVTNTCFSARASVYSLQFPSWSSAVLKKMSRRLEYKEQWWRFMVYYHSWYSPLLNIVAFHPILGVFAAPCGFIVVSRIIYSWINKLI